MQTQVDKSIDLEAQALAAVYRLLLQEARERRTELEAAGEAVQDANTSENGNASQRN